MVRSSHSLSQSLCCLSRGKGLRHSCCCKWLRTRETLWTWRVHLQLPLGFWPNQGSKVKCCLQTTGSQAHPCPIQSQPPGCGAILVALGCLPVNKLRPLRPEPPKPGQGLFYHSGKRVDGSAVSGDPGQSDRIRWTQTERNVKGLAVSACAAQLCGPG